MNPLPFDTLIGHTKPLLPPWKTLAPLLQEVWDLGWLSNQGPQVQRLEQELRAFLRVGSLSLVNNGTTGLMVALKALNIRGQVVTTPFTFPATVQAIRWAGLEPIFCDIRPDMTLDADLAKAVVDNHHGQVGAVLPVHVFGNPCDVAGFQHLADRSGVKIVYDAAHAFGLELDRSIGCYGDATMFSFHATKLFHTAEGGAIVFSNEDHKDIADRLVNFGLQPDGEALAWGLNGKMNEMQAALGRAVLPLIETEIQKRDELRSVYRDALRGIPGLSFVETTESITKPSRTYFAVVIEETEFGASRDEVLDGLRRYNVLAKRYFFPLCSGPGEDFPVASRMAKRVLVLPYFGGLGVSGAERVAAMVRSLGRPR